MTLPRPPASALQSSSTEAALTPLTGPQALTTGEIAALVAKATGKTLEVVHVSDEALTGGLKNAGLPDFFVPIPRLLRRQYRKGHFDIVTTTPPAYRKAPIDLAPFWSE